MQDQVDLVTFDPGTVHREWRVGHHFVDVATTLDRGHALLHGKYRAALVGHHGFIGVNTHQQIVTMCPGLA